jgi:hypothetical protein
MLSRAMDYGFGNAGRGYVLATVSRSADICLNAAACFEERETGGNPVATHVTGGSRSSGAEAGSDVAD